MKNGLKIIMVLLFVLAIAIPGEFIEPSYATDAELTAKLDKIVSEGTANNNYHVSADDIYMWLKMKKTDFFVVDVRIGEEAKKQYEEAHIPGAIYIPYNEILKPENLKKLPKDKKIILYCHMGVTETIPLIPLRLLGYDAYGLLLGMAGWQKDYPAGEFVKGLLNAPNIKNYPLEKGK